ncbi:peptide chain release factor N(5)-glutamine methyltransferase [Xinfangfangia sp. CPCC 101601]|uniref:Release factor glutamine methyltransferase n=1 Tax=Pseudogemmobacter lacusdianii TaxID=3069608 RepID=A0ABU0VV44_9RHOB|nr:peptide chain release factor N(5)-glutamine methyltransferase [Xinfangfangia sp. CPCC 101601]MDQ2065612.1 peptide chain release factor N(5)-glutamine methyltransferase [Xinfangfangia sp. CPCC 101601]
MIAKLALAAAVPRLRAAGVEDAPRDARLLLAHAMDLPPERLLMHSSDEMTAPQLQAFEAAVTAREARVPVSQILGRRLFWGRSFRVTAETLDPRPETEVLIEHALSKPYAQVLDLGTGTGCILLTLLAERPQAQGLGTDIAQETLDVAQSNADSLGLGARARFTKANWLDGITGSFDLIVSNPPYIALDEMAELAPEVRQHEPQRALTDGADGLTAYREIAAGALRLLAPGGRLLFEIGPTQGSAVAQLLEQAGFVQVEILPDLDQRDRVVAAHNPKNSP